MFVADPVFNIEFESSLLAVNLSWIVSILLLPILVHGRYKVIVNWNLKGVRTLLEPCNSFEVVLFQR